MTCKIDGVITIVCALLKREPHNSKRQRKKNKGMTWLSKRYRYYVTLCNNRLRAHAGARYYKDTQRARAQVAPPLERSCGTPHHHPPSRPPARAHSTCNLLSRNIASDDATHAAYIDRVPSVLALGKGGYDLHPMGRPLREGHTSASKTYSIRNSRSRQHLFINV